MLSLFVSIPSETSTKFPVRLHSLLLTYYLRLAKTKWIGGDTVFIAFVCLCVRSEPVNQTVGELNLTYLIPVPVRTWPLNIYGKGRGQGHVTPKFLALNAYSCSKTG